MPFDPNEYEDSHQKIERLTNELKIIVEELKKFFELYKKEQKGVDSSFDKGEVICADLERLSTQKKELEEKLRQKDEELDKIHASLYPTDEEIDLSAKINSEICSIHEQILAVEDEIDALMEKMEGITFEEIPGGMGDSEGTKAIFEMKLKRAEEIKKELEEWEAQDK